MIFSRPGEPPPLRDGPSRAPATALKKHRNAGLCRLFLSLFSYAQSAVARKPQLAGITSRAALVAPSRCLFLMSRVGQGA